MVEITQEIAFEASQLHQQSQELENNLEVVSEQITELSEFSNLLDSLISKPKDILSPIGKGVYLPCTPKDNKLFVEVGSGIVVKKTPEETKSVVSNQLERLKQAQGLMSNQLDFNTQRLKEIISNLS